MRLPIQKLTSITVDAIEVLIKYCINLFPHAFINSYEFKFLFTSCAFPIGQPVLKRNLIGSSRSNRKLINFVSNELINLRKGIGAIFYQHFYCIDSKAQHVNFDSLNKLLFMSFLVIFTWVDLVLIKEAKTRQNVYICVLINFLQRLPGTKNDHPMFGPKRAL